MKELRDVLEDPVLEKACLHQSKDIKASSVWHTLTQ